MGMNTAGTLVGSILESAGYIYQAHILDKLGNPLTDTVGALVYLLGIAIVIFQLAILRQSKGAMWLLFGPPLFLACITARSDIGYARWSFGSHERSEEKVVEGLSSFTDTANGSASTSTVFRKYVQMIAPVIAKITDKVSGSQDKNDMWFLFKGEVFSMLGVRKIENEGLRYLIQYALMGECYKVFDAARTVTDPLRVAQSGGAVTDAEFQAAKNEFDELIQKTKITIRPEMAKRYIASLENKEVANETVLYSCLDIWRMTLKGLTSEAGVVKQELAKESEERELDPSVIENLIAKADGKESANILHSGNATAFIDINKIIAGYLLRNEIRSPSMGALVGKFINRTETRSIDTQLMGGENAATEYARIGLDEWSEKERLVHVALSMPYYQGLALYFLGITYPFFALLLLIPGKAMAFLNWFMLWLWVKSWDIGFAIVMKIDTLFWGVFVETKAQLAEINKENSADYIMGQDDMFFSIAALDRLDPSFQAGTYYTMIAVCLMSVPVMSAQLVLGASNAGASLVSEGLSRYSDYFATSARGFMAQDIISSLKSEAKSLQEQAGLARATSRLLESIKNESEGGASSRSINSTPGGGASPLSAYEDRMKVRGALTTSAHMLHTAQTPMSTAVGGGAYDRAPYHGADAKDRMTHIAQTGERSAWSSGLHKPFHFSDANQSQAIQRMVGMVTLGDRVQQKAVAESELKNLAADVKGEGVDAAWHAGVEVRAYELHRQIARFSGIPIPWTVAQEEGSTEEFERHLARFDQRMDLLKATLKMTKETTDVALGVAGDMAGGGDKQRGVLTGTATAIGAGVSTLYSWNDLSSSAKSHFRAIVDRDSIMEESAIEEKMNHFMSELPPELQKLLVHGAGEHNTTTNPWGEGGFKQYRTF